MTLVPQVRLPADIAAEGEGAGAPGAPGAPAGGFPPPPGMGGSSATYALPPPTVHPPPQANQFRVQGINAAQVLADLEVTLATFNLPAGNVGVIRLIEFDVNSLLLTSIIDFRIRINGMIPTGWTWRPFPTAAAFFAKEFPPESVLINVVEGARVDLTAQVLDAGTYTLGGDLQGWFYPLPLSVAYENAWRAVGGI